MSNSSSDVMVWVKEAGVDGAAFRVSISLNAIADDLKNAIEKHNKYTFAAHELTIQDENGTVLEEDKLVSDVDGGKQKGTPIYFSQPTGKFRP